jgi:hypothetical protein
MQLTVMAAIQTQSQGINCKIAAMQVEFFQGPDPTPEPDAFFGGSIIGSSDGSGPPPEITEWMRPSFVVAGAHGPYLRITGFGDGNHAGFDPVRPYILHIRYEPDSTFEPAPQALFGSNEPE